MIYDNDLIVIYKNKMNRFGQVAVGFGNSQGQTTEIVISEHLSRI